MCTKFNPTDDGRRRRPIRNTFSKARHILNVLLLRTHSSRQEDGKGSVLVLIQSSSLTHIRLAQSNSCLHHRCTGWNSPRPLGDLGYDCPDRSASSPASYNYGYIHSVIICRLAGWLCRGTCVVPSVELAINITLYRVVFDYIIIDATAFHSLLVPMRIVLQLHFDLRPSTFFCRANRLHLHSSLCVWRACEGLCSMDGECRTNAKDGKRRRRT